MKLTKNILFFLMALSFWACKDTSKTAPQRAQISLAGQWQFALDTALIGIDKNWFTQDLLDNIQLPGTTDSNQKGFLNKDTSTIHLNRQYTYEGAAWYRKKISIPENFEGKHIQLFLERSKSSKIWIDDQLIGGSHLLQSPQQFDVTKFLLPGKHYISILVNNDLKLTPYGNVHIYSDDTQTNWNGILGKMYLEASSKTYISNLQAFPDLDNHKVAIDLEIESDDSNDELTVEIWAEKEENGITTTLPSQIVKLPFNPKIHLEYPISEVALWDEYEQPIYHLTAMISNKTSEDAKQVDFGMRKFAVEGTQFQINGRTTFLRGKHESAVFPLTGYAPTDVSEWVRVYQIAKSYGINHYRFHSYCPPEAAFIAADQEGIYLQAELPFWGGLESDTVAQMLREEGYGMLKAYANHPSFVMFSPGNEIWGGHDKVAENMKALKAYDDRPLYTMGSNNNIGYMEPQDYAEYFVGARVPDRGDTTIGHTRLTHAFADSWHGGILNNQQPSTEINFEYAVNHMDRPIVSHEIGQYQIYPNYNEIDKYTGNLKAWNLEVFKDRLAAKGMASMDSIFQKASGAWSALCYKAEMEAAIRTKGMAGFQLLDLQDFPGQGTALVGILDAFMDSKGVVSTQQWKQSCNDVVVLLEFPKYVWQNNEDFEAAITIANYSNQAINTSLKWQLKTDKGELVTSGGYSDLHIPNGELTNIGTINVDLSGIDTSQKLIISASLDQTEYANQYPVWVYPAESKIAESKDILISDKLTTELTTQLENGAIVLLFPTTDDIKDHRFPGHFPPEFWNYGMFKGISEWTKKPISPGTLGLLTDPEHPIFDSFPTDFHTNWQWFSIIKASNSLILDNTPNDYQPIVQVIDNLERNHKLGLIFEFKVGKGKLLVCMAQLQQLMDHPEAAQLYQSILTYMSSENFKPEYELTIEELNQII